MSFNGGLVRRKLESMLPARPLAKVLEGSAAMRAWKICFGSSRKNPSSALWEYFGVSVSAVAGGSYKRSSEAEVASLIVVVWDGASGIIG